ncbi:conserved Plasmodium protein, unknown function [Plasmodium ovale curtisi]|uniref:Uncharacterized protein n=1 Tax=Plasmodium ovale curtisi TaxID=864141 RepID=A0A1A8VY31_PLAOA|nr:conserved Plasmodium protein, unknown function [Plasmodium ovale curtisi]SBS93127.1 conserved Plasmodium protein, unknown function [Plasmodium ovale curtisi]
MGSCPYLRQLPFTHVPMERLVVKTNNVYLLTKMGNILDVNAVRNTKIAIKKIILDIFGLTMLLKVDFKILKVPGKTNIIVLRTDVRLRTPAVVSLRLLPHNHFLTIALFLYAIQPNQTSKHDFTLKVLKVSNFLTNLTHISGSDLIIETN